eukprot:scaffold7698_cov109-Cylindrotheca_fusiformis.AAC.2
MCLSSFLADLLKSKGIKPHQVSIVSDNSISQGKSLCRRKALSAPPSGRIFRKSPLYTSLRKSISDPSFVPTMKRRDMSRCKSINGCPCDPTLGVPAAMSRGRGQSWSHDRSRSNSTWNYIDSSKNTRPQSPKRRTPPRDNGPTIGVQRGPIASQNPYNNAALG